VLFVRNIKLAIASLRSARWRSFLTMLGIIIGVASVVTTVSIGEGIKQQVTKQINQLGSDLITIQPGRTVVRDEEGKIKGVNYLSAVSAGSFAESDWKAVAKVDGTATVLPFNVVSGLPRVDERTMDGTVVLGATPDVPNMLNQKVEFGTFFNDGDVNKQVVVIGKRVAEQLFQENVPIGKTMQIRGHSFIVRGVFEEFPGSPLIGSTDYNTAIFMPYNVSKVITGDRVEVYQVLVKPTEGKNTDQLVSDVRTSLRAQRGGEEDFTVLKQDENLAVVSSLLNILTRFVAGVAAISLLVGGIGIMNIMLVLVSERTKEIGVRKAVGATNYQIMTQFMTEAAVISVAGGFFGVLASIVANYIIRITTDLTPVITLPIMFISVGVALIVGVVFGTTPAIRAARKDPIESLRHE
jgi:putative ABC transport system permease protein